MYKAESNIGNRNLTYIYLTIIIIIITGGRKKRLEKNSRIRTSLFAFLNEYGYSDQVKLDGHVTAKGRNEMRRVIVEETSRKGRWACDSQGAKRNA